MTDKLETAIREIVQIPRSLDRLINALNSDLYSGPLYFNKYGEEVSMFDDEPGIHQFDFCRASGIVSNWIDANLPNTLYHETWSDCFLTSEPEGFEDEETGEWIEPCYEDYVAYDRNSIRETILGRELARTI